VRLLLDEMLSPAIARELGRAEDPEVLSLARAQRRAVVTKNVRDFCPLHVEAVMPGGPGHYGMIFMAGNYRRTKSDTGRIIAALEAKIKQHPGDEALANAEEWL
jgi:hypothetical protein